MAEGILKHRLVAALERGDEVAPRGVCPEMWESLCSCWKLADDWMANGQRVAAAELRDAIRGHR